MKPWSVILLSALSLTLPAALVRAGDPPPAGPQGLVYPPLGTSPGERSALPADLAPLPPPIVVSPSDVGDGPEGHFEAGAGVLLLRPFFTSNPAFTAKITRSSTTSGETTSNTCIAPMDFCSDLEAAPLVWLGYVSDSGLGLRGRWWQLHASSGIDALNSDTSGDTTITSATAGGLSVASPGALLKGRTFPPPLLALSLPVGVVQFRRPPLGADALDFESNLNLQVWDVEATQDVRLGHWSLLVCGGMRYAHLSQDYNVFRFNSATNPMNSVLNQDFSTLLSGHNFSGAGPLVGIEAWRPLGFIHGLALYGSARGAILFGTARQRATLVGTTSGDPLGNSTTTSDSTTVRDTFLPVLELELGAQYTVEVGRLHPFLRVGVESQTWWGAGNASSMGGNLGLLGMTGTAGFDF